MLNQIEQQVRQIRDAINDDSVYFGFRTGVSPKECHSDGKRRVIFVVAGGEHGAPFATGEIQVEENKTARPLTGVNVNVTAHIIAESATAVGVLWQNVVNASHDALRHNSIPGEFDFNPDPEQIDGFEFGGINHIAQDFTWRLHMFDGIVALPDPCVPVTDFADLGPMAPMTSFTHTGEFE